MMWPTAKAKLCSIKINHINLIFHIKIFKIKFKRSRGTVTTNILKKNRKKASLTKLRTLKMYCYYLSIYPGTSFD